MPNSPDTCPDCGFVWDGISLAEAIGGINDSVTSFIGVIEQAGEMALVRPSEDLWSIVEYAAHLRDVLLSMRERTILASVVDMPTGTPIYRDERVNLGFYSLDSIEDVADELACAAGLLSKTLAALPENFEQRSLIYSTASPMHVTIEWMAGQAFHEASHHLGDVQKNLASLHRD